MSNKPGFRLHRIVSDDAVANKLVQCRVIYRVRRNRHPRLGPHGYVDVAEDCLLLAENNWLPTGTGDASRHLLSGQLGTNHLDRLEFSGPMPQDITP